MEYRIVYRRDGTDEALEHHGIKGQKWGVRRFQDEKGRLTYAGKERYNTDISETSSAEQKKTNGSQNWCRHGGYSYSRLCCL